VRSSLAGAAAGDLDVPTMVGEEPDADEFDS
jgi:hypothetical protein